MIQELRLGNILQADIGYIKVESILGSRFRVYGHSLDEEYMADYAIDDLKPIPLTHELLEKIGFNGSYYFDNGTMKLSKDNRGYVVMEFSDGFSDEAWIGEPMEYLHQLQNAYFVLFQKELPINL